MGHFDRRAINECGRCQEYGLEVNVAPGTHSVCRPFPVVLCLLGSKPQRKLRQHEMILHATHFAPGSATLNGPEFAYACLAARRRPGGAAGESRTWLPQECCGES